MSSDEIKSQLSPPPAERASKKRSDDLSLDLALRPKSFDEYVGQESIKKNLKILIEAAKKRNEPLEHLLFYGQAGLGKPRWRIWWPRKLRAK